MPTQAFSSSSSSRRSPALPERAFSPPARSPGRDSLDPEVSAELYRTPHSRGAVAPHLRDRRSMTAGPAASTMFASQRGSHSARSDGSRVSARCSRPPARAARYESVSRTRRDRHSKQPRSNPVNHADAVRRATPRLTARGPSDAVLGDHASGAAVVLQAAEASTRTPERDEEGPATRSRSSRRAQIRAADQPAKEEYAGARCEERSLARSRRTPGHAPWLSRRLCTSLRPMASKGLGCGSCEL